MEAPEEASSWVSSRTSGNGTVIQFLPLHLACLTEAPLLLVIILVQPRRVTQWEIAYTYDVRNTSTSSNSLFIIQ